MDKRKKKNLHQIRQNLTSKRYQFEMPGDAHRVQTEAIAVAYVTALEDYPNDVESGRKQIEALARSVLASLPIFFKLPLTNDIQALGAAFVTAFSTTYETCIQCYQQDPELFARDKRTLKQHGRFALARAAQLELTNSAPIGI